MNAHPHLFLQAIKDFLPSPRIHDGDFLAQMYAVDASPFESSPFVVADVERIGELKKLLAAAAAHGVSLTFRGSGTSVSGPAVARDAAVRFTGSGWSGIRVLDGGRRVFAQCGARGGEINAALAPYGRLLSSDPSSIASATIGGMAANNAAGLSCTVETNIFHMLDAMQFVLADGTMVDTADSSSVSAFRASHAALLDSLGRIRDRILAAPELAGKIRRKYRIRNTCGYSLNAFTDCSDPVDILCHLLIGSEGTLGFILSVTLRTLPLQPCRATALISFASLEEAMQALRAMRDVCELYAGEFLDDFTLRGLATLPGFPGAFRPSGERSDDCALLIEVRTESEDELERRISGLRAALSRFPAKADTGFTRDPAECEKLWDIRRALLPAVAGTRKPSEYAYTEDYCVPFENLPEACHCFTDIMKDVGFEGCGVQGHALHGNLHCLIPLRLSDPGEVARLGEFIERAAQTVLRLEGSLKAEHGTGRAVAAFVRREWGGELYGIMQEAKRLLDPAGILNIGCLLNGDDLCHLHGLKHVCGVSPEVDLCMECGFCESICPAARQGLSPRQRVYALRAIAGLEAKGEAERAARWKAEYQKMAVDLCAADGLCTTRCPLGIDVAARMRLMRHDALTPGQERAADFVQGHMGAVTGAASIALGLLSAGQKALGGGFASLSRTAAKKLTGMDIPPLADIGLCGGGRVPTPLRRAPEKIVYFPSCAVRTMGYSTAQARKLEPLMDTALRLIEKAGYEAVIPRDVNSLCCGKAFETKGMAEQARASAERLDAALMEASENGRWPVMCDTSPCLARMRKTLDTSLQMYEPVEFALRFLAGRLSFSQKYGRIAVHATCSTRAMGLVDDMVKAASLCAREVVLPKGIFCCGFAGDKGFTHPELNAAALEGLAVQVQGCEAGFSTSRTCEIGLTRHGRIGYRSILYLLDECSEAR